MGNFSEERKGYKKKEVDAYISKIKYDYEIKLTEQTDRIFKLVEENKKKDALLEEYKSKDNNISKALVKAVETSSEMEETAEMNYAGEMNSIRIFHKKLEKYLELLRKKYPLDKNLMQAHEFNYSLDKVLNGGISNKEKMDAISINIDNGINSLDDSKTMAEPFLTKRPTQKNEESGMLFSDFAEKNIDNTIKMEKENAEQSQGFAFENMQNNSGDTFGLNNTQKPNEERGMFDFSREEDSKAEESGGIFAMFNSEKERVEEEPKSEFTFTFNSPKMEEKPKPVRMEGTFESLSTGETFSSLNKNFSYIVQEPNEEVKETTTSNVVANDDVKTMDNFTSLAKNITYDDIKTMDTFTTLTDLKSKGLEEEKVTQAQDNTFTKTNDVPVNDAMFTDTSNAPTPQGIFNTLNPITEEEIAEQQEEDEMFGTFKNEDSFKTYGDDYYFMRLDTNGQSEPVQNIVNEEVEPKKEEAFDLDEILHPKEDLDLKELCRELGLSD